MLKSEARVTKLYWTLAETRGIRVMVWRINFGWPRYTRNFYDGPNSLFTFGPLWIDLYAHGGRS